MFFLGPMAPWLNITLALPVTLFLAVLSWHWIERPALALARSPGRGKSERAEVAIGS